MLECTYHKTSFDGVKWVETPVYYINGQSDTHFHVPVFSIEKTHKNITALLKRLSNGDYKRYEVKQ